MDLNSVMQTNRYNTIKINSTRFVIGSYDKI